MPITPSPLQLRARLVHAEPGRRVVELTARLGGELLGSSLGEGASAEEAEDRALARLQQRLTLQAPGGGQPDQPNQVRLTPADAPSPQSQEPLAGSAAVPYPASQVPQALAEPEPQTLPEAVPAARGAEPDQAPAPDPEDWSGELAQIDLELRRLGWRREQESRYLERAFGHPSRSRLTSYADLLAYLQTLQGLDAGSEPSDAAVPLRRRDLVSQCDALLAQLAWDGNRGRGFLEQHFQVSSRQLLSDTQLLQFNMLLEGELIGL
ncbi:MAG: hypothetical protein ACKO7Z_07880 [Cyanobacteriota bacterium]